MQFIDLHRQYKEIGLQINKRIMNVLDHKGFIEGPEVKEFEEMLKNYTGMKYVLTCASGTDALVIPLMAFDVKKEDAVFVPSFSFFASAECISLAGATPVFVDSDDKTFNIDPIDLEEKIKAVLSEGNLIPKGIISVDLFGLPAEYKKIKAIAEKYDLFLLEDAAQGFGGRIGEEKACSFGDVASTSFFPAKPLGCYGDGGAIFTNQKTMYEKMKSIHVHGKGKDKYDNIRIGLNSRLDSIQAAILIEKLKIFDTELEKRNTAAQKYNTLLKDLVESPRFPENYFSSWAQYTLKADSKEERDKIVIQMKEKGIPIMVYYPIPIHKSEAYKKIESWSMDRAEHLSEVVFSLPMHPYLKDEEIEEICSLLKDTIINIA